MKLQKKRRRSILILLAVSVLLVISGVLLLLQAFAHYNDLSLQRQDRQLRNMALAADENIDVQLNNFHDNLSYVINRRGFSQAEAVWVEAGESGDLLIRMQENLVTQHSLVHAMLAMQNGEIFLSTNGKTDYYFPRTEGELLPCFSGDGTLYLAIIKESACVRYAALLDMEKWYDALNNIYSDGKIHLMLLGNQEKILLHQWADGAHVTAVEELNENNCDMIAVRAMMKSRSTGISQTISYPLTYPGDTYVHEMRMAVIPLEESMNEYFIVGLTSDYDEIINPMHATTLGMIAYGSMTALGVLMMLALAIYVSRHSRSRDREIEKLQLKNEETQKLLEKARELAHLQRLETIGTMTASIAHEFNNLLTPIMGYSIMTLEALPDEYDELAENISEIYDASCKAKAIIARLSALTRKNAETSFVPLSLDDLARKALEVASPAQPALVEIETDLQCGDHRIAGNETQLAQLLLNLILNAFQAMEKEGGTLALSTWIDGDSLVLQTADSGCGISAEAMPHIFDPFYTTKESGKGTGLGLAIVQQVVESHRGQIQVESQEGQGAVFTLRFPLHFPDKKDIS